MGLGLAKFMVSSQVLKSINFAIYSFTFVTLAYWIPCRYNYSKRKFELQRLEELMKRQVMKEGTEEERALQAELNKAVTV